MVVEDAGHGRQKVEGDGAVHEQRFSGVTGRVALGLGVFSHANGYVEVGFGVDVGVADALKMLDHRNGRFGRETGDEALAAARNKHVDVVAGPDELAHQGAVGGFDELDGACGEAFFGKGPADKLPEDRVAAKRLMAAAQDDGVARLDGKGGGVDRHIGTGLVDHGEHAEGHAHAAHLNAAWPEGKIGDSTHGILECGDLAASFGHGAKTYGADRQTIEKGLVQTFGAGGLEVGLIGGADVRLLFEQKLGDAFKHRILGGRGGASHGARGFAGLTADAADVIAGSDGDFGHDARFLKKGRRTPPSKEGAACIFRACLSILARTTASL